MRIDLGHLRYSFIVRELRHILALFWEIQGNFLQSRFWNDSLTEKDFIFNLIYYAKLIFALNQKLACCHLVIFVYSFSHVSLLPLIVWFAFLYWVWICWLIFFNHSWYPFSLILFFFSFLISGEWIRYWFPI